jgi:hypothetical protein
MLKAAVWPYGETTTIVPVGATGTRVWTSRPSIPAWVWLGPLGVSLMPVAYLLLGQSMRLARIRRAHLVRIWAYSTVLAPVSLASWMLFGSVDVERLSDFSLLLSYGMVEGWLVVPAMTLAAGGAMWWCASTRYLRLAHGRAAAVVMTFVVGLAMLTVLVVISLAMVKLGIS